ncbi:MAG: hypothetical protein JXM73_14645 [Anaerolineae bacterium]|nr:hypothetical protein [Anaerolineae bacterium]
MERVAQLIADYQWWIYGVLGLVLIFFLRRAMMARREIARSTFKLEQEQAQSRYNQSVVISAVILLAVIGTFVVSSPLLTTSQATPEPTPTVTTGPLVKATLTPTPLPPTITPTPQPSPTPLVRPTRTTPTPIVVATNTPEVRPPNCPNPNARITSPGVNQVVKGSVAVHGTANIDSFQYYKIEVGLGRDPNAWTVVGDLHYTSVAHGQLGTFSSGVYSPGTYTLRLVVVDQTGNYPEPCRVTIIVQP